MKKFNHGKDLAKEIGCSEQTLTKTITEYNGEADDMAWHGMAWLGM